MEDILYRSWPQRDGYTDWTKLLQFRVRFTAETSKSAAVLLAPTNSVIISFTGAQSDLMLPDFTDNDCIIWDFE